MQLTGADLEGGSDEIDPEFNKIIEDIDNSSEDEGIEDYKKGGYHTVHVG